MSRSQERDFEALDYGSKNKIKLTAKQYLVYSYLMSISKWNALTKENHYYIYKNSFLIKDACEFLKISQPTWRSAIQKLEDNYYVIDKGDHYRIRIPNSYAPLDIELIRYLLAFGSQMKGGGIIISLYSVLYKYWVYSCNRNNTCEVNLNQLRTLFTSRSHEEDLLPFKMMMSIFETSNLIEVSKQTKDYKGHPYTAFIIKKVKLQLPSDIVLNEQGPNNVEEILEAIQASIEASNI